MSSARLKGADVDLARGRAWLPFPDHRWERGSCCAGAVGDVWLRGQGCHQQQL